MDEPPTPATYSMQRYLQAKRTVDDRALNRRVLDRVTAFLDQRDSPDVVEVGTGTGAMITRALAWDLLPDGTTYTAIDIDPTSIDLARETVQATAIQTGYEVSTRQSGETFVLTRGDRAMTVTLREGDALDLPQRTDRTWDLLVGAAFADLLSADDIHRLLELVPDGGCYFPITFDGRTTFAPSWNPSFDTLVERRYHADMEDGSLGHRAGRGLVTALSAAGWTVDTLGGADWAIRPLGDEYPADEAYVIHYLLHEIDGAVAADSGIDRERFERWVARRHRQVAAGELCFVAHNLDVFARFDSSPGGPETSGGGRPGTGQGDR